MSLPLLARAVVDDDLVRARRWASWSRHDVHIDFPAMAPLVRRMRATLLGLERDEEHRRAVDVRLTPVQARKGGRLCVDVPTVLECGNCQGRGEFWTESCVACAGVGQRIRWQRLDVMLPGGLSHGTCLSMWFRSDADGKKRRVAVRVVIQ